jgi:hypothetical protein
MQSFPLPATNGTRRYPLCVLDELKLLYCKGNKNTIGELNGK